MTNGPDRLLVVEDDDWNREWLTRLLRRKGFEVDAVESGQKALELIAERPFDIVLLDNMMPGMSGCDVLGQLRQKFSAVALPVIMVTAQSEMANVMAAMKLGANDYVRKPVDIAVLLSRISVHLAAKRPQAADTTNLPH